MLSHLRHHAVAYLALLVALTTGTAYAADELPKRLPQGSVGAKQLKAGAVTSVKVKDGSLTGADVQDGSLTASELAAGVLPPGATVSAGMATGFVPAATPDNPSAASRPFTAPRSGTALLRYASSAAVQGCSSGAAQLGLYVDGVPVAGSGVTLPTASAAPVESLATVPVTPGAHVLTVGVDCPGGTPTGGSLGLDQTTTVVVFPS